jgi:glutathione S-transferase
MAQPPAKAEEPWELIYWSGFPGRGEFIRLLFAAAGEEWVEITSPEEIRRDFFTAPEEQVGFPVLAPPAIRKGSFTMCQTPAILRYLGQEFNMAPSNALDAAHADQVSQCVADLFADGRRCFHPVNSSGSYSEQKEEAAPHVAAFQASRLPRYLKYFERVLNSNGSGSGFAIGSSLSYVDVCLFHAERASEFQFPEGWATVAPEVPLLHMHYAMMRANPRLKAYIESDRAQPFTGDSMM